MIEICTLNVVMSVMLDETLRVITAALDCPGASLVPSLSHAIVIGPLALAGVQLIAVRLRVNETPVPVFLT